MLVPYGNSAVICVLEMLFAFAYWECCCYCRVRNIVVIHVPVIPLLFVYLVLCYHLCNGNAVIVCVL